MSLELHCFLQPTYPTYTPSSTYTLETDISIFRCTVSDRSVHDHACLGQVPATNAVFCRLTLRASPGQVTRPQCMGSIIIYRDITEPVHGLTPGPSRSDDRAVLKVASRDLARLPQIISGQHARRTLLYLTSTMSATRSVGASQVRMNRDSRRYCLLSPARAGASVVRPVRGIRGPLQKPKVKSDRPAPCHVSPMGMPSHAMHVWAPRKIQRPLNPMIFACMGRKSR